MSSDKDTEELSVSACLAHLRETSVGRLAVVVDDRPEIFPINHTVDHGSVVFRTGRGSKLSGAVGRLVAYESDGYDPATSTAWSVVVHGRARELHFLHDVLDALQLDVSPWESGAKPHIVRIEPTEITGRRFVVRGGLRPPFAGPVSHDASE